jgi:hypothetical protein
MGKRVGKPYDPAMRLTEHGARIYQAWRKIRRYPHSTEWDDFPTFYEWSMLEGYALGDWLRLIDKDKPYGPDNCVWYTTQQEPKPAPDFLAWEEDWNRAVNRIRKHYGMPPLRGTNYADL